MDAKSQIEDLTLHEEWNGEQKIANMFMIWTPII